MPTDDYIKRSEAVFAFCGACKGTEICGQMGEPCDEVKRIRAIPAADVEPVRHGHWIMYAYDEAICSECNYDRGTPFETTKEAKEHWDELPMWCEGCGAKMDGEPPKEEDDG